jgi:hypothetical protein
MRTITTHHNPVTVLQSGCGDKIPDGMTRSVNKPKTSIFPKIPRSVEGTEWLPATLI